MKSHANVRPLTCLAVKRTMGAGSYDAATTFAHKQVYHNVWWANEGYHYVRNWTWP